MHGHENSPVSRKQGMGVNWEGLRKIEKLLLSVVCLLILAESFNYKMMAQTTFFFISSERRNWHSSKRGMPVIWQKSLMNPQQTPASCKGS